MRLDGLNAVALVVVAICIAALHGCGGTMPEAQEPRGQQITRRVLMIAQTTMDALVVVVEPTITEGLRACEGDEACLERWQDARGAYRATRAALSAVQDAYQAYLHAEGGEDDWIASLSCARSAAASLLVALSRAGVDAPEPLIGAVESIALYLGPCPEA